MRHLQRLVEQRLTAIEAEQSTGGRRWSLRRWEEQHGLSNGTLGQIANGRRKSLDIGTIPAVAAALQVQESEVSAAILRDRNDDAHAKGKAPVVVPVRPAVRDAPPTESPKPPPVSETRISDDKIDALINQAFDGSVHMPSDTHGVYDAMRSTALLAAEHIDPVSYVRRLLDAQAEARHKGKRIPLDELPFAALGVTERTLTTNEQRMAELQARLDKLTREADAFIEQEGLTKPPPGEVHPALKKAQDRERKRREGR